MSARDDFPITARYATLTPCTNPCKHDHCIRWRESRTLVTEIDRLRSELATLTAVVAAVHAALDQYNADWDNGQQTAPECLATIAKAVRS